MITCPECGQQVTDQAGFCDRCGQGLAGAIAHPSVISVPPLEPGTELKGSYRITELLTSFTHENRYRALRIGDGVAVLLREQPGPVRQPSEVPVLSENSSATGIEDSTGPRAKTAELRWKPGAGHPEANGSSTQGSPTGLVSATPPAAGTDRDRDVLSTAQECAVSTEPVEDRCEASLQLLTDVIEESSSQAPTSLDGTLGKSSTSGDESLASNYALASTEAKSNTDNDDLGDTFGRVLALSMTLNHPAFQRAFAGFAHGGRVYLVYHDEEIRPLSSRPGGMAMGEAEALNIALQVCQAVSFVHRRALRINDLWPQSVGYGANGRIKLTGLDCISNDNELQSEQIFNDGYTAPEIYRGKRVDKRADIFAIGALLYTCITGERLDSETWREEAGPIRFYPPHVVSPALERVLRRALQFDPAGRWSKVDALKAELAKLAGTLQVRSSLLTDVGRVREHNEDSVLAVECKRDSLIGSVQTFLYVVADGMGGAEAGEVASAIAVETIRSYVEANLSTSATTDLSAILQEALEGANSKIIEYQKVHTEAHGMGSTAVAALIKPPEAGVAWVGDSRAYICDGQGLRQLSKDHSLVQRLIEIGQITPAEARNHEHKNVITRSLGARPTGPAGAESVFIRLRRGDRLLLCSDGLTTHVDDQQINELLLRHSDPAAAARELVVAANAEGGTDNVSVVVIVTG